MAAPVGARREDEVCRGGRLLPTAAGELLRKFSEASERWAARAKVQEPSVSTQCATLLDLKAPTPTRAVKASLSRCLLAVTGGAEPTRFFNSLPCRASKNKQSVCGAVWKRGNIAYRCLDCEVDANSAVCVDCFRAADHEGHDYRIVHINGGYDCGTRAWRPSNARATACR